jgi:hypothetical protein
LMHEQTMSNSDAYILSMCTYPAHIFIQCAFRFLTLGLDADLFATKQ